MNTHTVSKKNLIKITGINNNTAEECLLYCSNIMDLKALVCPSVMDIIYCNIINYQLHGLPIFIRQLYEHSLHSQAMNMNILCYSHRIWISFIFIAEYGLTNMSHADDGHSYIFISIRRLLECFTNYIYLPTTELFLELFSMMSQHHFADHWLVTTQYLSWTATTIYKFYKFHRLFTGLCLDLSPFMDSADSVLLLLWFLLCNITSPFCPRSVFVY